jgi:hypothetical protein
MEVMAHNAVVPHHIDDDSDPVLATVHFVDLVHRHIGVVPSSNHCPHCIPSYFSSMIIVFHPSSLLCSK